MADAEIWTCHPVDSGLKSEGFQKDWLIRVVVSQVKTTPSVNKYSDPSKLSGCNCLSNNHEFL